MQAMLNMRQSMAGMTGAPGAMPQTPAATGIPPPATDGAANPGAGALPNPMFDPAMMQAMQAMMGGGMGGGAGFGGMGGMGGMPGPTDARPSEELVSEAWVEWE